MEGGGSCQAWHDSHVNHIILCETHVNHDRRNVPFCAWDYPNRTNRTQPLGKAQKLKREGGWEKTNDVRWQTIRRSNQHIMYQHLQQTHYEIWKQCGCKMPTSTNAWIKDVIHKLHIKLWIIQSRWRGGEARPGAKATSSPRLRWHLTKACTLWN